MRRFLFFLIVIHCFLRSSAQDLRAFEFGLSLHSVVAVGDEPLDFFDPNYSLVFTSRINFPYRVAIKASFAPSYNYTKPRTGGLGWEIFKTSKAFLGVEYNLNTYNAFDPRKQKTTYIMLGVSYELGNFKPIRDWDLSSSERLGLNFGLGFKSRISPLLLLSGEFGVGYFLSDDFDRYESGLDPSLESYTTRGGNDFFLFPNVTLTYTFPRRFRISN